MPNELDKENISALLKFTVEDDFSYFCKHDELIGVVAIPDTYLPSIEESCFNSRANVFDLCDD